MLWGIPVQNLSDVGCNFQELYLEWPKKSKCQLKAMGEWPTQRKREDFGSLWMTGRGAIHHQAEVRPSREGEEVLKKMSTNCEEMKTFKFLFRELWLWTGKGKEWERERGQETGVKQRGESLPLHRDDLGPIRSVGWLDDRAARVSGHIGTTGHDSQRLSLREGNGS